MTKSISEALMTSGDENGKFGFVITSIQNTIDSFNDLSEKVNRGSSVGGMLTYSGNQTGGISVGYDAGASFGVSSLNMMNFVEGGHTISSKIQGYGAFIYKQDDQYAIVSPEIGTIQMQQGINVNGGSSVFLKNGNFNVDDYAGLEKFIYGAAVDVDDFLLTYFCRCYSKIQWTRQNLISLMSQGLIWVHVYNNETMDSRMPVLLEYKQRNAPLQVYLPFFVLIHKNEAQSLQIKLKGGESSIMINEDNTPSELDFHKIEIDGTINVSPKDIEKLFEGKSMTAVSFEGYTFNQEVSSCRFYLRNQGAVQQIIGDIPEDYIENLFDDSIETVAETPVSGDFSNIIPDGQYKIMIDVGHGLWRQPEYGLNKNIAETLKQILESKGVGVTLIDVESAFAPPEIRAELEQFKGKKSEKPYNNREIGAVKRIIGKLAGNYNCYISIHCDAGAAKGAHTCYNSLISHSAKSRHLAQCIGKRIIKIMGKATGKTGGNTGNTKGSDNLGAAIRNDLGILKVNSLPGCLVECGFYDNPKQRVKLENPNDICQAIAAGIIEWCNVHFGNTLQ